MEWECIFGHIPFSRRWAMGYGEIQRSIAHTAAYTDTALDLEIRDT